MEDRGRKTERTLGWIADKEAPGAEKGTEDPSRALVSERRCQNATEKCGWLFQCVLCSQAYVFTTVLILTCVKNKQIKFKRALDRESGLSQSLFLNLFPNGLG